MDQLVVLQEIHESISKGGDGLNKIDNKAIEGSCPNLVGKLLEGSRRGRIDESVCRELSEKLQDVYEVKRLGDICRRAGQPAIAVDAYKRALSLCDDPVLRPVLQNNLGQAHVNKGDLARAEFYYQQSAEIFKKEGDRTGLAHVLGNLGSAYRQSGEWNKAIEKCYQSLKTFEEAGDDLGIAQMTGSIGRIYADMGENELAARYFEKSLSDFQKLGDKRSAAWVLDRLGRIARERMDWDLALSYFQSSVSIFEEMGESSSLAIALSNLGRTFLQMNEPNAAREPLERAVLQVSRQARPGYQNALYCLAKTYGSLAEDSLLQAETRDENRDASGEQQRREASRFFSLAADRYQDLAGTLDEGKNEIGVEAALAKSRAYLSQISGQTSDDGALVLVDRALSSLDNAAANATDEKKAMILNLQRIVSGMKEVYSFGSLSLDEKQCSRALTNSSEYLMGAANGLESEEALESLCRALKGINAGIEAERSEKDPAERFLSAASELLIAKEHLVRAETGKGKRCTDLIENAAAILKESASKSGEEGQEDGSESNSKRAFCGDERAALLAIAGAMAAYSLERIEEKSEMLAWDEALHLLPASETAERADLPAQETTEGEASEDDASEEMESVEEISDEVTSVETEKADEGFLLIVKPDLACQSTGQLLLPEDRQPIGKRLFHADADQIGPAGQAPDIEPAEVPGYQNYAQDDSEEAADTGIDDLGPLFGSAPNVPELEEEVQPSPLVNPKALLILKALTLLVLMLLLIEAILYLI
ncbi:MAG: hypothetical protein QG666_1302 [Euryarchaeota archaeon]|nr:hypothetical protein [Euryarchaeota archaeon]